MTHSGWRRRLRRAVPGIAWRDDRLTERAHQVADLRRRLAEAERDAAVPVVSASLTAPGGTLPGSTSPASFRRHVHDLRRGVVELQESVRGWPTHPLAQVNRKLRNHRLAASHGVPVPEVLAVWDGPDDLDLSDMPDEFVLKSDGGAGGRGVFPLRRVGRDSFRLVGGDDAPAVLHTQGELAAIYRRTRHIDVPLFAEAMLFRPGVPGLSDDIKIYAFYGQVGQVLLRRVTAHGVRSRASFRYLDAEGADLGPDAVDGRLIDPAIPPPADLGAYLQIARHLSRAMALPFVRVDLYETAAGPVFGELTRGPGGPQRYREDLDQAMGTLWDEAQCRLDVDVVAGRPLAHLHGTHPSVDHYPPGHPSVATTWPVVSVPCDRWCGPDVQQ